MELARRERLAALVAYHRDASPLAAALAGSQTQAAEMTSSLRQLVRTFADDPATRPFLKGLATLMEKQFGVE